MHHRRTVCQLAIYYQLHEGQTQWLNILLLLRIYGIWCPKVTNVWFVELYGFWPYGASLKKTSNGWLGLQNCSHHLLTESCLNFIWIKILSWQRRSNAPKRRRGVFKFYSIYLHTAQANTTQRIKYLLWIFIWISLGQISTDISFLS